MRLNAFRPMGVSILASGLVALGLITPICRGDDTPIGGRLGRLLRLGGSNSSTSNSNSTGHNHEHNHDNAQAKPKPKPINGSLSPSEAYAAPPTLATPPTTAEHDSHDPGPKISAQPRVSKPPTEADPILTRIAVGRSDGGGQFGMFLQVFADGTVIDTEGVHRVNHDVMKSLLDVLHQGDLYRVKGHCGAPSTDFVDHAHIVVYERAYGKLRASSFSYSGNPQGCDPSIKRMHAAIEAIQMKVSSTAGQTPVAGASTVIAPGPDVSASTKPSIEAPNDKSPSLPVNAPILAPPAASLPNTAKPAANSPVLTLTPNP